MLSALKFMLNPKKHYKDNPTLLTKWAKKVYKKYNNTCVRCGYRAGGNLMLEAHHIYPKSRFPQKVYKVSNGICLCEICHRTGKDAYHKMVSLKNSSPKTLKWWLRTTKKEKQPILVDIVFATIVIMAGILFAVILFLMKF